MKAAGAEHIIKHGVQPFKTAPNIGMYTAGTGRVFSGALLSQSLLQAMLGKNVDPKGNYLFISSLTTSELVLLKMYLASGCQVFTTSSEFLAALPLLDLLVLTTSTASSAHLIEVYVPTEDKEHLRQKIRELNLPPDQLRMLFKNAAGLYNEHAPKVVEGVVAKRIKQIAGVPAKGELLRHMLSRQLIALQIRQEMITNNIQRIKY
jgi:hypothetical protein